MSWVSPDRKMPGLAPAACQPAENERGLLRQNGSCQAALPILSAMSSERPESVLLTLDEVAAALGMSRKSVQRRIKAGVIRTVPLGGRLVRISSDELRRLTTSNLFQDEPKDPDLIK